MGEQWSSESHFKHTVRGWIPSDLKEEGQTSHRDATPWAPSPGGSLGIVHTPSVRRPTSPGFAQLLSGTP